MKDITIDTTLFDIKPYMDWITNKIEKINYYVSNNKLPDISDPYVDNTKCFFCLFQEGCEVRKK